MIDPLTGLDGLSEQFATTNQRLAVTVAAVGTVLFVALSYRDAYERIAERTKPLYADVAMATVLVGTSALAVAVTLGAWGQTAEIGRIYADLPVGEDVIAKGAVSFVILLGASILMRFVARLLRDVLGSSSAVTEHQEEITYRITQVVLWSMAIVVILGVWIDDLSSLLVGAGVLGIVVGMAARQTLGTMLAGFVLMFARPFEIGHWIEVDGREGVVTDISIVNTRIRTAEGEYVEVPNDLVSSSKVANRSKRGRLRIEVEVGVDYETDLERAETLATAAVDDLEEAMDVPEPRTVAKRFGDSAVVLGVRFWIDQPTAPRRARATAAAVRAIKESFEAEGIAIPFPQRELSGRTARGGLEVVHGRSAAPRRGEGPDGDARTTGDDDPRPAGAEPAPEGD